MIFKPKAPHSKPRPEEIQLLLAPINEILLQYQVEEKRIAEEEKAAEKQEEAP